MNLGLRCDSAQNRMSDDFSSHVRGQLEMRFWATLGGCLIIFLYFYTKW